MYSEPSDRSTILNERLETNLQNYAKEVFLWSVLQLAFRNFLPKNLKIWLFSGRLGTRHQIQALQGFS